MLDKFIVLKCLNNIHQYSQRAIDDHEWRALSFQPRLFLRRRILMIGVSKNDCRDLRVPWARIFNGHLQDRSVGGCPLRRVIDRRRAVHPLCQCFVGKGVCLYVENSPHMSNDDLWKPLEEIGSLCIETLGILGLARKGANSCSMTSRLSPRTWSVATSRAWAISIPSINALYSASFDVAGWMKRFSLTRTWSSSSFNTTTIPVYVPCV